MPVQSACWEAYISCAFVAARTERISMLLAARAGFIAPTVMAKMIATFDQLSGGRVKVNLITGGSAAEMAADGLFDDHDERYERLDDTEAERFGRLVMPYFADRLATPTIDLVEARR